MFDRIHLCFPHNLCQIDKSINCIALPLLHITRNNCWPSSFFKTETNALAGVNRGLSSSECVSFCTSLNVPSYCSGHYKSDSLGKLITDTDIQAFPQPLNNTWPQYKCQYRSLLHPWVPHLIINRSLWTRNLNVSQPQFYCCRRRQHSITWWNSAVKWCIIYIYIYDIQLLCVTCEERTMEKMANSWKATSTCRAAPRNSINKYIYPAKMLKSESVVLCSATIRTETNNNNIIIE